MKRFLLCAALILTLAVSGCNVLNTIVSYLPIFEAAVNGVVALVGPTASAAVQADEAKINSTLADLQTAVNAYDAAPSTSKATAAQNVSTVLGIVETSTVQLETDMGISTNSDVKLATAILDLSIGTYQAIITKIAGTAPTTSSSSAAAARGVIIRAGPRPSASSPADYKRKFNALVVSYNHPEMQMHLSVVEHLHMTSR